MHFSANGFHRDSPRFNLGLSQLAALEPLELNGDNSTATGKSAFSGTALRARPSPRGRSAHFHVAAEHSVPVECKEPRERFAGEQ